MLGVDFGFTNPTAIVEIKKDDDENYWITNEWYKTQRTNQQIIEAIKSFGAQEVYPDPEAPDKINDLNLAGINVIEVKKSKDSIANGITKIKELFKQNRLYIHSSCVNLITELETYHYPDRRPDQNEQENPVAENNHALDAIRYCFSNEIKSEDAPTYQQRPYEGFSEYEGGTLTKGDKVVMNGLEFERIS
jgi:phage terminase large subunit